MSTCWDRFWGRACCLVAGLLVPSVMLLLPSSAMAWKPATHMYLSNQAAAEILAGRNSVTIDGHAYRVEAAVASSIRAYPKDFRAGAVGPDAFGDIAQGQGAIHPDTRTENGTRSPDNSLGHSYTWQWLVHIYKSGWSAYKRCGGCTSGKRALAFSYGFLMHAAQDVFGHTFINAFAGEPFPAVSELVQPAKLRVAIRHIIVEGYVGEHTPLAPLSIDAPIGFLYSTFIQSPDAARYGRGAFVEAFVKLESRLVTRRNKLTNEINSSFFKCVRHPIDCAERAYINAWLDDIASGLKDWPNLSLALARDLFATPTSNVTAAKAHVSAWVRGHLLSMLGLPDFVGRWMGFVDRFLGGLKAIAGPLVAPIEALKNTFYNWLFKQATGLTLDEWKSFFTRADTWINNSSNPLVMLPSTTSGTVDALMGLPSSGLYNTRPFDLTRFAAAADSVMLSKLTLLDSASLNQVLRTYGVPGHYARNSNVMFEQRPNGTYMGWVRSIDGDHQWLKRSPLTGRQYGEGTFFLWQDCAARQKVFRVLFRDWEHGSVNFPNDDGTRCSSVLPPS